MNSENRAQKNGGGGGSRVKSKDGLAAAAGQMSVVVGPDGMARIDIPPALLTAAIQGLEDNLNATKRYKNAEGEWEEAPDYAVRQKAIETLLAYGVGLPVQRQIQIRGNFTSWEDKLAKLAGTPEGLRMLEDAGIVSPVTKLVKPPSSAFSKGGEKTTKEDSLEF